jgi:hypothetical protein
MKNWRSFKPKDGELSRLVQSLTDFFKQLTKHGLLRTDPGKGTTGQILTSSGEAGDVAWSTQNELGDSATGTGEKGIINQQSATADIGAGPSQADFNNLLQKLRDAGLLDT